MSRDTVDDMARRVMLGHSCTTSSWATAMSVYRRVRSITGALCDVETEIVRGRGPVFTIRIGGRP